jgi:hypothetical protein
MRVKTMRAPPSLEDETGPRTEPKTMRAPALI